MIADLEANIVSAMNFGWCYVHLTLIGIFILPSFTYFNVLQIKFVDRFKGDNGSACLMSIDCTDYLVHETAPFCPALFSYKFKHAALRYEIGISIQKGEICWINGPFPPRDWPDITIFRSELKCMLGEEERVEADNGYVGEPTKIDLPREMANDEAQIAVKAVVRARHETINRRFKQWGCMNRVWRHEYSKHGIAFRAIAVLIQLGIFEGDVPFQVEYKTQTLN